MTPKLIGLYSSTPECGKTEVAKHLQLVTTADYGLHTRISPFAGPLKHFTGCLLGHLLGCSQSTCRESVINDNKNTFIPEVGKTVREILQFIGTDIGRKGLYEDIWVDQWKMSLENRYDDPDGFITDDVRFPNEYDAIKSLGGQMWKIERPSHTAETHNHSSEGNLDDHQFDRIIVNDGSIADLHKKVEEALRVS